jgi:betaine-homocysteine S-methyltransferase
MAEGILERLEKGPVLGDGGYVFILKERGVPMKDFTPHGILTHEQEVGRLYREFYEAGADVIQAQTFQGTRNRLEGIGEAEHFEEIHRRAVGLARSSVGDDVLIAGSIGSAVGSKGLSAGGLTASEAFGLYDEECRLLTDLGVDFFIVETYYWMDDVTAALKAAKQTGLPVVVTVSFRSEETLLDGTTPEACARIMQEQGADAVGINCMREPARMMPLVKQMREAVDIQVAAQPVGFQCWPEYAYLGDVPDWTERVYEPRTMADYAREAAEMGVGYIGSCCGSGPDQVKAMAEVLGKRPRD